MTIGTEPLARARARLSRPVHGRAGRDDRERRAAVDPGGLHFTPTSLQWIVNAYTLIFGGFLLLGGRASDLLGRQRLFLAGIFVFTAASLINGIAQSSDVLIARSALQGLGAALVSPAALSIVTTTFAEGAERTKALGVWSAIAAGGGAVGLVLGGFLTETLSWRWIFFVNLPIGIAAALLSLRFVPNSRAGDASRDLRRRRRGHGHRRTARARLRDRQGAGLRLGLVEDRRACSCSRSCCSRRSSSSSAARRRR